MERLIMKKLILAFCVTIAFGTVCVLSAKEPEKEQEPISHTQWIASVLKEIETIKVGATREKLLEVFTTEGGISTPTRRTYVYRGCSYIKVDAEFEATPQNLRGRLQENPKDKIVKISRPYLQWSICD